MITFGKIITRSIILHGLYFRKFYSRYCHPNFTNTLLFSHRLVVALDADEGIEAWHVYMENCLVMLWLYYLAI